MGSVEQKSAGKGHMFSTEAPHLKAIPPVERAWPGKPWAAALAMSLGHSTSRQGPGSSVAPNCPETKSKLLLCSCRGVSLQGVSLQGSQLQGGQPAGGSVCRGVSLRKSVAV